MTIEPKLLSAEELLALRKDAELYCTPESDVQRLLAHIAALEPDFSSWGEAQNVGEIGAARIQQPPSDSYGDCCDFEFAHEHGTMTAPNGELREVIIHSEEHPNAEVRDPETGEMIFPARKVPLQVVPSSEAALTENEVAERGDPDRSGGRLYRYNRPRADSEQLPSEAAPIYHGPFPPGYGVVAEAAPVKTLVDADWLREKIAADPDLDCEVRPAPAVHEQELRKSYDNYSKSIGFQFPPAGLGLQEWGWQLWKAATEFALRTQGGE